MAKYTPCDDGQCPFGDDYGMYFCRDNCGLGVDEDNIPEEEEYDDDAI